MSEVKTTENEKDYFWIYVGLVAAALIAVIVAIKINESDKYSNIQQLQDEEMRMMNIRVLN